MYTDAFNLIFKLCQNQNVVKEILFTKKGFRVRWTQEKSLFWYKIGTMTEERIEDFLELYEIYEEKSKK